ncbi:MAG TPA: hypothetical protein DCL61_13380 [Cyanobacteria bacterium UBA12227]|nr:hypothetical protein [Cyanobacteria bacterium UBA12227]HAX87425.1 hypothetical protein [Cyanobacteria bacterium UBA11370]HBY77202.1 hypothetical protein [Cyanobacteria bacterium UBA11148]
MTLIKYNVMDIDELRRYVLSHREDIDAFQAYIDRSKAEGRMIGVNSGDSHWEAELAKKIPSWHHPQEQDYWNEDVEVEVSTGQRLLVQTYLLRIYPETFNSYDAYMDIPIVNNPHIKKVHSSRLGKTWEVISGPTESLIRGYFRGDYRENNPPAWIFGLKVIADQTI